MRSDQERVRDLLTDTVTLLCKSGLNFNDALRIEGVLGITVDGKDVFIVHINEFVEQNNIPSGLPNNLNHINPIESNQSPDNISSSEVDDIRDNYYSNGSNRRLSPRRNGVQRQKSRATHNNSASDTHNTPEDLVLPNVTETLDRTGEEDKGDSRKDYTKSKLENPTVESITIKSEPSLQLDISIEDSSEDASSPDDRCEFSHRQSSIPQNLIFSSNPQRSIRSNRRRMERSSNSSTSHDISNTVAKSEFSDIEPSNNICSLSMVNKDQLGTGSYSAADDVTNDVSSRVKEEALAGAGLRRIDEGFRNSGSQLDYVNEVQQQMFYHSDYSDWLMMIDGQNPDMEGGGMIREKNFVCNESGCTRRFYRCSELYRHQRTKHGASFRQPNLSCKRRRRRVVEFDTSINQ